MPKAYKSYPKWMSLAKWKILTPLQKLPKMCWRFGQNNICPGLWKVVQSIINRPIWSHWWPVRPDWSICGCLGQWYLVNIMILSKSLFNSLQLLRQCQVWPDVGLKSSPIFPKVTPKSRKVLLKNLHFSK